MKKEIAAFVRAFNKMKKASSLLDDALDKQEITKMNISQLVDLEATLPRGYRGARKVLEQMIRLEDNE